MLSAIGATRGAVARVREAFVRHHRGEWVMPPKVYLDSPPFGDASAPCRPWATTSRCSSGSGTSFPANPERGLPTVTGLVCLSDARTGEPLMLLDARSVTALRTGAVAAVAARALRDAPGVAPSASSAAVRIGAGGALHGRRAATGPACAAIRAATSAQALAGELGWEVGDRRAGAGLRRRLLCHPRARDRRATPPTCVRACTNMLGADAAGKAEGQRGRGRLVPAVLR